MSRDKFGLDFLIIVSSDPRYDTRSTKFLKTLLDAGYRARVVGICSDGEPDQSGESVRVPIAARSGKKFFLEFYSRVIPYALKMSAKVVIAGDLFSLPPAIVNKRKYSDRDRSVKLIYDSKELYRELPSLKVKKSSFMFWNLIERSSIRYVDAAFTVNKSIADILRHEWQIPFTVIRNVPGRISLEATSKSFDKIVIAFSGGLQPGRGLHNLVRLLELLPGQYELTFVGDGVLRDELAALAASLGLHSRVHFKGRVRNSDVIPELSRAHLGVYLMENSGLCHYLALPNKFFQFISARLPVIVPRFPEMEKIVNDYGIGAAVDPTNLDETAKKVIEFTRDREEYERLSRNCERAALELNWEEEKKKFLEAVGGLVQ